MRQRAQAVLLLRTLAAEPSSSQTPDEQEPAASSLVRIAFWRPKTGFFGWHRALQDPKTTSNVGTAYMIIDVTNLYRDLSLGGATGTEFEEKLKAIAELLLIAADHNGETYWRIMIGELETLDAFEGLSDGLIGGAIPGSFVSPIVGASLAGAGLLVDVYTDRYLDGFDANDYATIREAAATYRKAIRLRIDAQTSGAEPGSRAVQRVLELANEYAFTYSVKGTLYAVSKQNEQLESLLESGQSAWQPLFAKERAKNALSRTRVLEAEAAEMEARAEMLNARAKEIRAQRAVDELEPDRVRREPQDKPDPDDQPVF
ncbi:MAG: hypothetical protein RIE77_01450 [Phycisphaerales bacterium]